jgi:HEAT repeat protein
MEGCQLHYLLTSFIFCYAILQNGFAQQIQAPDQVKLYRYGDLLRDHGIELTEPALLNALENPDASARYLAVMKLAEDNETDAIPAIEQALTVEKVPRDRVNIALALALLGDKLGSAELKKICADKTFVPEFRLYAVRYMFDLHIQKDEDCLNAVEATIEWQKTNFGDRISALAPVSRFQGLTADESRKVLSLVAGRLRDPEPVVRMAASQSLAGLGDSAAVPYLEAAIATEQDENIRRYSKRI